MAGVTTEGSNALDLLSKLFSKPQREFDAVADRGTEAASGSDLPSQTDVAAKDTTQTYEVAPTCTSHSGLSLLVDEGDSFNADQDSLKSRSNVGITSSVDKDLLAELLSIELHAIKGAESTSLVGNADVGKFAVGSTSRAQNSRSQPSYMANQSAAPFRVSRPESGPQCHSGMGTTSSMPSSTAFFGTTPASSLRAPARSTAPAPSLQAPELHERAGSDSTIADSRQAPTQHHGASVRMLREHASQEFSVGFAPPSRICATKSQGRGTQRTTVILRNIPKTYNTARVVDLVHSHGFEGKCDFVDVPSKRVSASTGGFAIVNLADPAYIPLFWKTFDGFTDWKCKSKNTCRVVFYEQLQGLYEITQRYKNLIKERKVVPEADKPWLMKGVVIPSSCVPR
eukprot:TRINITY_DN8849_c0_g3_i1.p1 TRINITY_DN8849_c0_g3~~TRINITY_DN8849_c0_g3_i1.p1  ORF type:complete len:398 (+),score=40.60 TRINITY_DN8849_c0_g3_i1:57-1250(+)